MTDTITAIDRATFEAKLAEFIPALDKFVGDYFAKSYTSLKAPIHTIERGQKYIRIVTDNHSQRSVYCFLDFQGNIYKSESWKKPAKHIRGSIFDDTFSLGKSLNTYGAVYLR